jgi:hypothetical protein
MPQIEPKGPKEIIRRDTPKKKRLVRLIIDNDGRKGERIKSKGELIRKASYSEASAHNPHRIFKAIEPELKDIATQMEEEREEIMKELKKKRKKAQYHQLITGADIMTKNVQLIKGKATEIIKSYEWGNYEDNKPDNGDKEGEDKSLQPKSVDQSAT